MKRLSLHLGILLVSLLSQPLYSQGTKVPPSVEMENNKIQDRFAAALLEECPDAQCYSSGCLVNQFYTLDSNQDSTLPGLESDVKGDPKVNVQYKLQSSRCEFSYEPSLSNEQITLIRQRLASRVKTAGVEIQIIAQRLREKAQATPDLQEQGESEVTPPQTWQDHFRAELFPFLPWIILLFVLAFCTLAIIWGIRRLGKDSSDKRNPGLRTRTTDALTEQNGPLTPLAEPSSQMIILRMSQLKQMLDDDEKLVEYTLKSHFEQKDYVELCLFLRHFGPNYLSLFKKRAELTEVLAELSEKYADFDRPETLAEHWQFLERLERKMISARVKINNQPLGDEFAFLGSISVDELIGLLKGETDLEAVATIAYAPTVLREEFFAIAPPALTAKIVEQLTKVDRLPDSFVRETAKKLRKRYNEHSTEYKTVRVNKTPLIEIALNHLSEKERLKLISDLKLEDPEAVKKLAPSIFLDECLRHLPSNIITETFLEVSPKDAAAYLNKFSWKWEITEKMNQRLKEAVEKFINAEYLDEVGAAHARSKIAKFVRQKSQSGVLDINKINRTILGSNE